MLTNFCSDVWCCNTSLCCTGIVVDRIRLSEPPSPGTAWFLDQLIAASFVIKLLCDLLNDSSIVSIHWYQCIYEQSVCSS